MINIVDKSRCSGCSACYSICPKNCIEMKEDEEGFLYPFVNYIECLNCGLCEKVCPLEESNNKKNSVLNSCIVQHKDSAVLKQSTSGGSFSPIAEYVLSKDGAVYGTIMKNEDFFVKHFKIERVEELSQFRGSKYVQSFIGDTLKDVKDELIKGRLVCYSGTPCQVQGLKNFLRRDYENLITVDVVCRGVPSPGVWKKYVEYLRKKGEIKEIIFRDKELGYQYSTMKVEYKNGKIERNGIESDQWLRMFFSGMIMRPSCPSCNFRTVERCSDFTIWDCFNVSDLTKEIDETKGASRMLVHTPKGMDVFDEISNSFKIVSCPECVISKGIHESFPLNTKKQVFIEDYKKMEMDNLLAKWFPISTKVVLKKYIRRFLNKTGLDLSVKKIKRKIKG